jgi:hypothetical protein
MRGTDSWNSAPCDHAFSVPITWRYGWKHFFGFHDDLLVSENSKNTLFIGIVRNPYDWIMAMYKMPHHLRPHRAPGWNRFDGLEDFLTASDLTSQYKDPAINHSNIDNNPYTLNGYNNIFDLRSVKLDYLYNKMPTMVENYVLIKYEEFSSNTEGFIENISKNYQLPVLSMIHNSRNISQYNIESKHKEYINTHLNWSIENLCGYTQTLS